MKVHNVKSVQPHFDDVASGKKTAELRLDDRGNDAANRRATSASMEIRER